MSDIKKNLSDFESHCLNTDQLQVAGLIQNAIKRIAELEKENNELKTKLSKYASELWVLQELRDRASNMDVDSYTSTYSVKWYASRIHQEESK